MALLVRRRHASQMVARVSRTARELIEWAVEYVETTARDLQLSYQDQRGEIPDGDSDVRDELAECKAFVAEARQLLIDTRGARSK